MLNKEEITPGTLAVGESHPAAYEAYDYITQFFTHEVRKSMLMMQALANGAFAGNRSAEVCYETLQRIINKEPVSDRYVLGLGWTIKGMNESSLEQYEKWLPVYGYEENYEVSNFGRVRRFSDCAAAKKGKILAQIQDVNGYLKVHLYKDGLGKLLTTHGLVLRSFIGKKPKNHNVNHKDGVKTNNYLSNLEYLTPSENIKHAHKLGLKNQKGEKNNGSKLTLQDVKKIKERIKTKEFSKSIAKDFNVSRSTIDQIRLGLIWVDIDEHPENSSQKDNEGTTQEDSAGDDGIPESVL